MRGAIGLTLWFLTSLSAHAEDNVDSLRQAVDRSLRRLEQGSASYVKNRQCFSCHHQALSLAAFQSAKQRGFQVAPEKIKEQLDFTLNSYRSKLERVVRGQAVPGGNTEAVYALFALEVCGQAPDEITLALIQFLLVRQKPDGSWPALMPRPPQEGSPFTNNALALRALKGYKPGKDVKNPAELQERLDKAIARGQDWLLNHKPVTTEDKVFRFRALLTAGAERELVEAARDGLLKEQRADGSWSQLPEREGDAYATGSVLMALRQGGVKPAELPYQKAVKYLLGSQKDDGSWLVETRSRPVQVFFDNGDPGGKSQFISFAATGWAVLALLETFPVKE